MKFLFISFSLIIGITSAARNCFTCTSCLPTDKNKSECALNSDTCRQTSFKVNGVKYVQRACESLAICEAYKMNPNLDLAITQNGLVTDVETSCCSDDLCNSEENINSVQSCYYCAYCSPLDRTTVPCGSSSDSCRQTSFMSNGVAFVQRSCETTAQCDLYRAFPQSVMTKLGVSGGVASNVVTSCCTENLCNSSNNLHGQEKLILIFVLGIFILKLRN